LSLSVWNLAPTPRTEVFCIDRAALPEAFVVPADCQLSSDGSVVARVHVPPYGRVTVPLADALRTSGAGDCTATVDDSRGAATVPLL
jgi:hypothetical protein